MMPNKIMRLNSSIPIYIDDTTFANDKYPVNAEEKRKLLLALNTERKCVLGCRRFASLRYVPKNAATREEWRRKLNLTTLNRGNTVCDNHFENGELICYSERKEENEIGLAVKHNRLSQNGSCPTTTTQLPPKTWEYEERKRRNKCILGCGDGATLHRVPEEPHIRMLWRDKLKLPDLKISHRVCANHFSHRNKSRIPSQAMPNSPPRVVVHSSKDDDDESEDDDDDGNPFGPEEAKFETASKTDPNAALQVLLKCKKTMAKQRSQMKRCILGCKNFETLHNVPKHDHSRRLWSKKLNLKKLKIGHKVCNNHFKSTKVKYIRSHAMPDSPIPTEEIQINDKNGSFQLEWFEDPKPTEPCKNYNNNNSTYESLVADILKESENEKAEGNKGFDNFFMEVLDDSTYEIDNENNSIDSFMIEMLDDPEAETFPESVVNNKNNCNEEESSLENNEPQTYENEYNILDMEILEEHESPSSELKAPDNGNVNSKCELLEDRTEDKSYDKLSVEVLEDEIEDIGNTSISFCVEALEDEIEDTGNTSIGVVMQETSEVSQFAPSRCNALKSWLQTEDFCITSNKKS